MYCVLHLVPLLLYVILNFFSLQHWFYDGEVICFQDPGHIALSIVAIIVLALLVLLSPALLIFTTVVNSNRVRKHLMKALLFFMLLLILFHACMQNQSLTVNWVMDALTEGYRDSWEAVWWTSWELFRRYLLIAIVVSLPGRSVGSVAATVCMKVAYLISCAAIWE